MKVGNVNPKMKERALYAFPPLLYFICPLPKLSSGNPYLKILDLAHLKKKKIYSLSEHFQIWV